MSRQSGFRALRVPDGLAFMGPGFLVIGRKGKAFRRACGVPAARLTAGFAGMDGIA
jgi:hypothetical protein